MIDDPYPQTGCLVHAAVNWAVITENSWILEVIKGYHLELFAAPFQSHSPKATQPHSQDTLVQDEVDKLIQKGAICMVSPVPGQFLSRIFTVPKKGGALHPVVNLRPLNKFMIRKKFKMENATILRDLVKSNNWMTSIDLKDAFLSVPVAAVHRKFLRFSWKHQLFAFQCLPFGLTSAP